MNKIKKPAIKLTQRERYENAYTHACYAVWLVRGEGWSVNDLSHDIEEEIMLSHSIKKIKSCERWFKKNKITPPTFNPTAM